MATYQLGMIALVQAANWVLYACTGSAFLLAILYAFLLTQQTPSPEPSLRFGQYGIQLAGAIVGFTALAYSFGSEVYPTIFPYLGGAAVRQGYVLVKDTFSESVQQALEKRLWPIVDMDANFLYVLACRPDTVTAHPETLMIPLDMIVSIGIASSEKQFVAVPRYAAEHDCGASRLKTRWM